MAQALDVFDATVMPHLPEGVGDHMKGIIRQKFHALALDAAEVAALKPGEAINGAAIELRDQVKHRPRPIEPRSATA